MLLLTEDQSGLWDRFQRGERLCLAPPPEVVSRWSRASDLGVAPFGAGHPLAVRGHDLVVRRDAALGELAEGAEVMEALEVEVGGRGLLAVLADRQGVIVRARGGDAFRPDVKKTRLVEGVRWDESARGTNAIGTALTERQPIGVVGRGHWERVNHGLFCYACPVSDSFGELVAVVDVTGPVAMHTPVIGLAVRSAAVAMETILRARAYAAADAGSRRWVERMLDKCDAPAVLIEQPGVIAARNDAAVAEFGRMETGTPVERLFGLDWDELERAALVGPTTFETRRRRFSVEFEPLFSGRRLLALVCFFSPMTPRSRGIALEGGPPMSSAFDAIFATDARVNDAKRTASRLAPSDVSVLLLAETGTGKELFAHAIHRASARASGPFVAVNCGALTGALLESELFGYAPGAFTGARPQGAEGKLAAAHGGTLFLDEIAELSTAAQAMLLRFLEDGSYTRVGEAPTRRANVRIVCATCRDLPRLVQEGGFRQDLFFRIHGGCVRVPPLRERTDRVPLARALLALVGSGAGASAASTRTLAPSGEAWVLDHSWPGNVRELKTALAHAVAVAGEGASIGREHFPEPLLVAPSERTPPASRRAAMRALASDALRRAGGNLSEAARALGVARSTLYRMLDRV